MKLKVPDSVYEVVIIGGGPAGLAAGLYASRANLKCLLVEGTSNLSQITFTNQVENYPGFPEGIGGFDLMALFKQHATRFGLEVVSSDAESIGRHAWGDLNGWEINTQDGVFHSLALIIATGTSWRRLNIPGEEEFLGRGVSNCATCDAAFYRDCDVMVIGGGDTAVEDSLFLTNFARKVIIVHRRDRLRASARFQKAAFANPKIEFIWNSVPIEIIGADEVKAVKIKSKAGETREVPVSGVFVFIGQDANTGLFHSILDLDKNGYVPVDPNMCTSIPGVFAAGDCTVKMLRQVVTACGDGATAAYSAQLYIQGLKGETY